jgi:lysyl-tRNA synthetase class 1
MVRRAFRLLTDDEVPTRCSASPTTWTACARFRTTCRTARARAASAQAADRRCPNPFGGDYESFGHHNNAMLRRFLDTFGFDYEFASATDYYKSGKFDACCCARREVRRHHGGDAADAGRRAAGDLQPVPADLADQEGRVLYVPMKHVDAKAGTITFDDEDGTETRCRHRRQTKLQWKPDFGMRWAALGVDFEMFGKDHQTNAADL